VVKTLVELHRGTVEVQSEGLGQGAELTVRLPLAPAEGAPQGPLSATPTASRSLRAPWIAAVAGARQ
jgi:two-component system CheB/CheR fusion protein